MEQYEEVFNYFYNIEDDDSFDSTSIELSNSSTSSSDSSSDPEQQKHQKIQDFQGVIQAYSNEDFKQHFRLNRPTAQILIDRYKNSPRFLTNSSKGLPKILPKKEIYMFLWYMANTNSFRELGNLFGVSKSTSWHVVKRVSTWLISISHEFVKWPNEIETMQNAAIFEERTKIPGILGCIDGSHVRIKAPSSNKESYFNRKKYYSVSLQGVVDPKKRFINLFVGEPGSLHDSRVLRRSDLYREAIENITALFPNNTYLLGDSAYASLDWLVPPFRDNGMLTNAQKQFNTLHSTGRVIVEHAFGLLKTRFRRLLHFTEQTHINLVVNLIVCGCVLHNMCIEVNDEFEADEIEPTVFQNLIHITPMNSQSSRREQLFQELLRKNVIRN